jgi:general secretion pathway protein C
VLTGAPDVRPAVPVASDASRFRLVGVAAPVRASGQGVAILSVDGTPPRAFKPGDAVDDARVVIEVSAHTVKIGPRGGPPNLVLQVPLLPPPATGVPAGVPVPPA